MTNFLMVVLFFITPPAIGDNRPWTLQSSHSSEFNSFDACDDAMKTLLIPAMQSTDTVSVFGWCIPKDHTGPERESAMAAVAEIEKTFPGKPGLLPQTAQADRLQIIEAAKPIVGSCYSYVPAAVLPGQKKRPGSLRTGLPGTCHSSPPS